MPNFNYGKPLGSPTALSLLIAPVSKLCCLRVEQHSLFFSLEGAVIDVWDFIIFVSCLNTPKIFVVTSNDN